MDKFFASWLVLIFLSLAAQAVARADDGSDRPRSIVSITICSPDPTGAITPSCGAAYDTERPVLAVGSPLQTINQAGIGTATDEHSTVFPTLMSPNKAPGHLSTHGYAFYLIGTLGACTDDDNDNEGGLASRTYASRQFTIVTAPR